MSPVGPPARTAQVVQVEYGEGKWPTVERRIEAILASETPPSLARVHRRTILYELRGDALERRDHVVNGRLVRVLDTVVLARSRA